jgi:hypothetical protein
VYENGSNLYRLSTIDGVDIGTGGWFAGMVTRVGLPESPPPQDASNIDIAAIETKLRFIEHRVLFSTVLTIAEFYKMSIKMFSEY